ncbi:MAG: glycosyltransferase family 9 protein [Phycisphaerae bacterium]
MATPVLRAIRARFGRASVTFLAVPNLVGLIEDGPWMDEVVVWPGRGRKSSVADFIAVVRRLRRQKFDLAVLLPNSFRSGLMARLAGARRRVGYDRDGRGWLLTDRLAVPRVNGEIQPHPICKYYADIARALGCEEPGDRLELFTNPECEASVDRRLQALGVSQGWSARRPTRDRGWSARRTLRDTGGTRGGALVVVSPGASFGASKLWLCERFAELGDRLIAEHGAAVVVICGPGEEGIARQIGETMRGQGRVLDDPLLTLGELKALIKRCDLLVCNDAGPRHIAKAFGAAVATVFGPTHQAWTDTAYPLERKVQIEVDCGPCQKKVCPFDHHKCMTGVSVDMVYERCLELLEARRQQPRPQEAALQ